MTTAEVKRIAHYLINGLVAGRRLAEVTRQRPLPSRVGVAIILENLRRMR